MIDRAQLSVFVTTFNNGRTLAACLESVRWADEIVVLDSFSADDTLAIARRHGARISQHEFLGYGAQKRLALAATAHDWVLLLDADEALRIGVFRTWRAEADGLYAYERFTDDEHLLCVLNTSKEPLAAQVALPEALKGKAAVHDLYGERTLPVWCGLVEVKLEPGEGLILE